MRNTSRVHLLWLMLAVGGACSSPDGLFTPGSTAGAGDWAVAGTGGDDSGLGAGAPTQTGGASLGGDNGAGSAGLTGDGGAGGNSGTLGDGGSAGKSSGGAGSSGGRTGNGGAGGHSGSGGASGGRTGSGGASGASGGRTGSGGASGASGGRTGSGGGGASGSNGGSGGRSGSGGGGGKAAAGAGGTSGAPSAGSANGGVGGAVPPTCPANCDSNADCQIVAGAASCTCRSGFVGNGMKCARPASCNELHVAQPALVSGAYTLKPSASAAAFVTYCEMTAQGGGWTLVLNDGPSFVPSSLGTSGSCYSNNGTNLAYSSVPLVSDVMLDLRDGPIVGSNQLARVVINAVKASTRGKTVQALFTNGPNYLEKENNSNLTVELSGNKSCADTLPQDMATLVCTSCAPADTTCQAPVIVFGDGDSSCVAPGTYTFAIGAANSYTSPWTNCAGWPQAPGIGASSNYPQNFRVWVR